MLSHMHSQPARRLDGLDKNVWYVHDVIPYIVIIIPFVASECQFFIYLLLIMLKGGIHWDSGQREASQPRTGKTSVSYM